MEKHQLFRVGIGVPSCPSALFSKNGKSGISTPGETIEADGSLESHESKCYPWVAPPEYFHAGLLPGFLPQSYDNDFFGKHALQL
jgi:hypothetical protein